MTFNKLIGGLKRKEKKEKQEVEIRIKSIMAEVGEVLSRRSVTIVEMNYMLLSWMEINSAQLVDTNNKAHARIAELMKQNDNRIQPGEDRGQENKE